MALFWSVVAGEVDQQIEVPTTSVASVRMVALEVESGTVLPDGDTEGQLLMWTFQTDPASWVPVPNNGAPTAATWGLKNINDLDPCSLTLGDGTVALNGLTAQMTGRLGRVSARVTEDTGGGDGEWQMSYSDGEFFSQIFGNKTQIQLLANTAGGNMQFSAFAASMSLGPDEWAVFIGEGEGFYSLSPTVGALIQVNPDIEITLQNTRSQYQLQSDIHVFRCPNLAGTPTNNVFISSAGDDMTVGFLGGGPVARQSITGATTQDQVDSLVAALVAFGLVSDDR